MRIITTSFMACAILLASCHPHHAAAPAAELSHSHDHEHDHAAQSARSVPGKNIWNRGERPEDAWAEMERWHGHVGPWNVIGLRMGEAILRESGAQWGDHTMDIVVHIPLSTPYSCLVDGLMVGTGNGPGRLDLRMAEVETMDMIYVSARPREGQGPILLLRPNRRLLHRIETNPAEKLEALSRECMDMRDSELFTME